MQWGEGGLGWTSATVNPGGLRQSGDKSSPLPRIRPPESHTSGGGGGGGGGGGFIPAAECETHTLGTLFDKSTANYRPRGRKGQTETFWKKTLGDRNQRRLRISQLHMQHCFPSCFSFFFPPLVYGEQLSVLVSLVQPRLCTTCVRNSGSHFWFLRA